MRPHRLSRTLAAALALGLTATASLAAAQVPTKMGYQGRLMRADGTPETGVVQVVFRLYDAVIDGNVLWQETQDVALTQGFYSTFLGEVEPLSGDLFDGGPVYLEMTVAGQLLEPRQEIASVGYAFKAGTATNLSGGVVDASSISVGGQTVVDGSGALVGAAAYQAGPGLELAGNTFSMVSSCATGDTLKWDGLSWACAPDVGVASVTVVAPLVASGAGDLTIALPKASGATSGYLDAADFGKFDAKVAADDPRLSDARSPTKGSAHYIQNQATADQAGDFRIGGSGAVQGTFGVGTVAPRAKMEVDGTLIAGGVIPTKGVKDLLANKAPTFVGAWGTQGHPSDGNTETFAETTAATSSIEYSLNSADMWALNGRSWFVKLLGHGRTNVGGGELAFDVWDNCASAWKELGVMTAAGLYRFSDPTPWGNPPCVTKVRARTKTVTNFRRIGELQLWTDTTDSGWINSGLSAEAGHFGRVAVDGPAYVGTNLTLGAHATVGGNVSAAGFVRGAGTSMTPIYRGNTGASPYTATNWTAVPGLDVTFTLPRAARVQIQFDGNIHYVTGGINGGWVHRQFGIWVDGSLRRYQTEYHYGPYNPYSAVDLGYSIDLAAGQHRVLITSYDSWRATNLCGNTTSLSCNLNITGVYQ